MLLNAPGKAHRLVFAFVMEVFSSHSSDVANVLLTGSATVLVCIATMLVLGIVLSVKLRSYTRLPAALFALSGAIIARFTAQTTPYGDAVFREMTVYWSVALAVIAVLWWFASGPASAPITAPATTRAIPTPVGIAFGAVTASIAIATFMTASGLYPLALPH